MKKILTSFIISSLLFWCTTVSAEESKIEKSFILFVKKIENKYTFEQESIFFKKLGSSLALKKSKKLSANNKDIVNTLIQLNNEIIFKKQIENFNLQLEQKQLEQDYRKSLLQTQDPIYPEFIKDLESTERKVYVTNDALEFVEKNTIYKIIFKRYSIISSSNITSFKNKPGIIVKKTQESDYWFVEDYSLEQKIPYSELQSFFLSFIDDTINSILEGDAYYAFIFSRSIFFQDTYGSYLSEIERNGINPKKTILYRNPSGKYNFASDFKKVFLADAGILYGIPDKDKILSYLKDDTKDGLENSSLILSKIRKQAEDLSKDKTEEQSIAEIYSWVLNHLEYSPVLDFEDAKIFSGLEGYKNKNGVCTSYAKLTAYLLAFAGVSGVEYIPGDVIDAQDFPDIGHAWLKIGDKYYDPTFDDPIGILATKIPEQYKYFSLPRDLFYTNRYDKKDTPESLKSTNILYRKTRVDLGLSKLAEKYSIKKYNLLKPFYFKKKYDISYSKSISPEILKDILPFYEIDGKTLSFIDINTHKKTLKSLSYYTINTANTESVLGEFDFDISGLYLFNWVQENGEKEFRIGYDVIF